MVRSSYQSPEVICIAINGYTNTGGAHGNMNITLYNFDAQTGALLELNDIIKDVEGFSQVVKTHFKKEIEANSDDELTITFLKMNFIYLQILDSPMKAF